LRDREAFLDLLAHVLAVRLGVLREEAAVDVRDLAPELRVAARPREVDRLTLREAGGDLLDADADERVGAVEPCHGEPQLLRRDRLAWLEAGREVLQHP